MTTSSPPIYTQVVVEAIYDPGTNDPYVVSSETGSVFVAESPEVFTYDDDGNLLSDGRFEYAWDGENRLIGVTTSEGLPEDMPVVHVEFEYDFMSRRTGKTVYEWDAGITNWTLTESSTFLYDGWNLLEEQTLSNDGVTTNHYVFGLDLSGSLQGAGGIGGLLATIHGTNAYFVTYDANGNVSEYVDASGDIAAHYEYSPFGETIVSTGPMAKDFAHRFSTKYTDDETGLLYYGYRFYKPDVGRWINRDPIEEEGGINLYGFVENRGINDFDYLGLRCILMSGPTLVESAEWKLVRTDFYGFRSSGAMSLKGVESTWEIEGKVECCCPRLFFFRRQITKTVTKTLRNKRRFYNPPIPALAPGVMTIPTPTSIAEAVAELVGVIVEGAFTTYIIYKENIQEVASAVRATMPSSIDDGEWPDDPCN